MLSGHAPMHGIDQLLLVPFQRVEKLLQGSRRHASGQRNGFHALAIQLGQLALDIRLQMLAGVGTAKTIPVVFQILEQLRFQATNFGSIHARILL